jgi:hypothetical protein
VLETQGFAGSRRMPRRPTRDLPELASGPYRRFTPIGAVNLRHACRSRVSTMTQPVTQNTSPPIAVRGLSLLSATLRIASANDRTHRIRAGSDSKSNQTPQHPCLRSTILLTVFLIRRTPKDFQKFCWSKSKVFPRAGIPQHATESNVTRLTFPVDKELSCGV